MDPRHLQRIKIVQNLYAFSFTGHKPAAPFEKNQPKLPYPKDKNTKNIIQKLNEIDRIIKKYAPRYPLQNIARTDLSILRMCVFDLIFNKNMQVKVTIDEGVRLAKELSGEKSYAFINAVLGKILNESQSN